LITLVGIFTDFGLPEALQKFLPQPNHKQLLFPTISLEFLLVVIGATSIFIIDLALGGQISQGYSLLLFFCIIFSASNTIILSFNGLRQNLKTSIYFLGAAVSFLIITFVCYFYFQLNIVESFLTGRLTSWLLFTIIPLIDLYLQKLLPVNFKLTKRYLSFAANNFVIISAFAFINNWDSIIITNVLGTYINGVYKSVATLGLLPNILAVVLNTKLLPEYSYLHSKKLNTELRNSNKKITLLIIFITVIFTLSSIPLSKWALTIIFSPEIATQGYSLLPFFITAGFAYVCSIPAVSVLQALGQESFVRNIAIIQSIIYFLGSILVLTLGNLFLLPLLLLSINVTYSLIIWLKASRSLTNLSYT